LVAALRRLGVRPTRFLLLVQVAPQRMRLLEHTTAEWNVRRRFVVSTSAQGTGQVKDSNRTPLGLHRIGRKVGGGQPVGAVFRARQHAGFTWQGQPGAPIVHRILWLEGLDPGWNRGGDVDSFRRFIYIHGFGDETTLGRPTSCGCIHVAGSELIPLYDLLPVGTLVWISEN
jgi:lipoprotein-anchoring transpeptidase ErfK/SrfK